MPMAVTTRLPGQAEPAVFVSIIHFGISILKYCLLHSILQMPPLDIALFIILASDISLKSISFGLR
jgi:hypothetical protein